MVQAAARVDEIVTSDGFSKSGWSDPSQEIFQSRFEQHRPDGREAVLIVRALLLPQDRTAEGQNFRWLLWADELAVLVPKD